MIRGIDKADLPTIRVKAEVLAAEYYPELIPDIGKEVELLQRWCEDSSHYTKCVGEVGNPSAVLVAKVGDNVWATRKHAAIVLWYSEKPGAGTALLRDFRGWVKQQKSIVLAGVMDDFGWDARLISLMRREGFEQRGGAYCFFPRGAKK